MPKNDHIPPSLQRFVSELIHPGGQNRPPGLLAGLRAFRDEAERESKHAGAETAARWGELHVALSSAFDGLQSACELATADKRETA